MHGKKCWKNTQKNVNSGVKIYNFHFILLIICIFSIFYIKLILLVRKIDEENVYVKIDVPWTLKLVTDNRRSNSLTNQVRPVLPVKPKDKGLHECRAIISAYSS